MAAPETDDSLSLTDAADALGVHYMTAYRYVRTGVIEAHRDAGRWVVPRREVDRVVAERTAPATTPAPRPRAERAPRLADRLIAGDEQGSWRLVQDARVSGDELDDVLLELVCPALHLVGARWQAGSVSIAEEHRATVVAMRLIGRIGETATRRGRPRGHVVLATAPGDRHGLPTAVVADMLRSRGIVTVDLGADTPAREIASAAAATDGLLAVGLCATNPLDADGEAELRQAVELVRGVTEVPILLGGAAIHGEPHATRLGADRWTADAHDLVAAIVGADPIEGEDAR